MTRRARRRAVFFAVLAIAAAGLSAMIMLTGGSRSTLDPGLGVDLAFAQDMVPHHRDDIAIPRIARTRAQRDELKALARGIIVAQAREIGQLQASARGLAAEGVAALALGDATDHVMEMDGQTMAGMHADATQVDLGALNRTHPFDRAFIDAMIPHHQLAILMARDVLARGEDPEVRRIADTVITARSREIRQMNLWRLDWYGAESPAGGVPR